MIIFLSSHDTMFVAVGENSQYLTQFSCFFNVYWSLRSTVDHTLTSLSSPHVDNKSPSQLNPMDLILALWALINETSLALLSKSTSQNLRDSSLEADTSKLPLGLNLRSWIWFFNKKKNYFMTGESVRRYLSIDIPEQDNIIHTSTGDILARGMEIQTHDGLFMALKGSYEAWVLLSLHFWGWFWNSLVFKFKLY